MRWSDYSGRSYIISYLGRPSVITRDLRKGGQEGQSQTKTCNKGSRGWDDIIAEARAKSQEPRNWQPLKTGKGEEINFSLEPPEGMCPDNTLI